MGTQRSTQQSLIKDSLKSRNMDQAAPLPQTQQQLTQVTQTPRHTHFCYHSSESVQPHYMFQTHKKITKIRKRHINQNKRDASNTDNSGSSPCTVKSNENT
jgi:hypothetical protein